MAFLTRRRLSVIFLTGCLWLVAGCSSPATESLAVDDSTSTTVDTDQDSTASPASEPSSNSDAEPAAEDESAESGGQDADDAVITTVEPLRPAGEPQPTVAPDPNSTSAYIVRRSMAAANVEVQWSVREGASTYNVHRILRSSEDEPDLEAMTDDNLVHVANDRGQFVDEGVVAGEKYWHGIRITTESGDYLAHGWHRTAAVDDEEPPSPVDEVTAVLQDGEVLVTWTEPAENYQLHSYRVLRVVNGEEPEQIGQTWRLDQMSFIDDDPPTSGEVAYQVRSLDFHWNLSEPAEVNVDLSS